MSFVINQLFILSITMSVNTMVNCASISMAPPTFPANRQPYTVSGQDFTVPSLVRCYCNMPECLSTTDGVSTCTSSRGCFANIEHTMSVPVTETIMTRPTTHSPILVPEEFIEGRIIINQSQLNDTFGCLDFLSMNQTCNVVLQSPDSKFSALQTLTMSQNSTSDITHAYHCCRSDMCNERSHVAATIQAAHKVIKPVSIGNSTFFNNISVAEESSSNMKNSTINPVLSMNIPFISEEIVNVTDFESNQTKLQEINNFNLTDYETTINITVEKIKSQHIVHAINKHEEKNNEQTTIVYTKPQELASSKMQDAINVTINTTSQEIDVFMTTGNLIDVTTIQPMQFSQKIQKEKVIEVVAITTKATIDDSLNTTDDDNVDNKFITYQMSLDTNNNHDGILGIIFFMLVFFVIISFIRFMLC